VAKGLKVPCLFMITEVSIRCQKNPEVGIRPRIPPKTPLVESKGMRVNMNKTKVMINGKRQKVRQKAVRWPCGVCSKGDGSNSLQCTRCQKWVHKKCSGIKGSMSKAVLGIIS